MSQDPTPIQVHPLVTVTPTAPEVQPYNWIQRQLSSVFPRIWNRMDGRMASIERAAEAADLAESYPFLITADQTSAYNRGTKELSNFSGETWEMRQMYRNYVQTNPTAKAALIGKIAAVISNPITFNAQNPDDPQEKLEAEFCREAWAAIPPDPRLKLFEFALPLLTDGWALSAPRWIVGTKGNLLNKWIWGSLKSIDTEHIIPLTDQFRNILAYESNLDGARRYMPEGFMYASYLPWFESPTGSSDLRAAFNAIRMRNDALRLRIIFLTKYTGPFLWGKSMNPAAKNALKAELQKAREGKVLVTDAQVSDIQLFDLATSGVSDFKAAIEDFDKDIVISIHGAFLHMLEGNNGPDARGSSTIAEKVSKAFQWLLVVYLEATIKNSFCANLIKYNFGEDRPVPNPTFETVAPQETVQILQIYDMVQKMGLPVSKKELYRKTGVTPPTDPTDTLAPPPAAAGPNSSVGPPTVQGLPPMQFDEAGSGVAGTADFRRRRQRAKRF
jgi:Protein of unknown function (DUF935)